MVIDMLIFTLRPEVEEPDLVRAATEAAEAFTASGGLLSRTLTRDGEGQWIDIIEWASLQDAERAAVACADHPGVAAFQAAMAEGAMSLRNTIPDA